MAMLGPFENNPEIAVAVSGGADSLCLAVLANAWARARNGSVAGLIVDHGLRPDSSREAVEVAEQLADIGVRPEILVWDGEKPARGIPAAARAARYELLLEACRTRAILHLLVAHHAMDQAETRLLRERAMSGADGLAGMAAVTERDGLRVLRPLLDTAPERMRATLRAAKLTWIEDPTNRDRRYARTRARADVAASGRAGELADAARDAGSARALRERKTARSLARHVTLYPSGHAVFDRAALASQASENAMKWLAAIIGCVAPGDYAPRRARLERMRASIVDNGLAGGRTLGGCLFLPRGNSTILVCREPEAATQGLPLQAGQCLPWDGRFMVQAPEEPGRYTVRRLDDMAWAALRRRFPAESEALSDCLGRDMKAVRAGLPVLFDLDGPRALPHLSRWRSHGKNSDSRFLVIFAPRRALSGTTFGVLTGASNDKM